MTAWQDRYWTSHDGLKLHYRDYSGPDDRPPIVMLPGLTRNCRDFETVAARLSGKWRVFAVDFRGRGLSQYDPNPLQYMPGVYAQDVIDLLDSLNIDKAVFFGTSLGALVTMIVGARQPERLAGALINDVGPEVDPRGIDRIRTYVGIDQRFADWNEAAAALRHKHGDVHPSYGDQEWLRYARRVCAEQGDGSISFDYDMAIAEPFAEANSEPVADLWPLFRCIGKVPVLILRGSMSDLLSAEHADEMRDSLSEAELVTVPGVGHPPDLDEPEAVAAIDRLLGRVLDRDRG